MANALATSASPYLRQHQDNPVDWRPWSAEAFAEARRRDVPVLVSIGYSTCHWCHVMAHECFEDKATAALMNERLVCIKVDREEHPEVDAIYMDAVQALAGHGGWPLNAFADHDGRPFYAVTYLPRERWGMLVEHLAALWAGDRERVARAAHDITAHIADEPPAHGDIGEEVWEALARQLQHGFDPEHPGYGWNPQRAPKFPPSQLLGLLVASGRAPMVAQAAQVLEAMQDSGLHDRVGGGFHRYSVDRQWRVPHFEKMLYDNAQLATVYARAGVALGRPDFLRTAIHVGDYLLRDLQVGGGQAFGLASAEDADDPGGEGSFYAWSPAELAQLLGEADGRSLSEAWDLQPGEREVGPSGHHEPISSHIPHPRGGAFQRLDAAERERERERWEPFLPRLRAVRERRARPGRDDKVLTDQNGLALEAFAALARMSGEARFSDACAVLARTVLARRAAGGLERLPGRAAYITDYGAAVAGLCAAFDLLGDPALVGGAEAIAQEAVERLRADDGGFYATPAGRSDLIRRSRESTDNAWPAGQHSLALGMVRLWNITGSSRWQALAEGVFATAAHSATAHPTAMATLLMAWRQARRGHRSVVVGGPAADALTQSLLARARRASDPGIAIIPASACRGQPWSTLSGREDLAAQALVCLEASCLAPATSAAELDQRLAQAAPP